MFSKTGVVLAIFVLLVLCYFVFMLQNLIKETRKKEMFEEDKKQTDQTKKDQAAKDTNEKFSEKALEMNMFVIEKFEELYDRKIKTDELKGFVEMFTSGQVTTKKDMTAKIEAFTEKKEKFAEADYLTDLQDIQSKLADVIKKMQAPADQSGAPDMSASKPVEQFTQNIAPFSTPSKYMSI